MTAAEQNQSDAAVGAAATLEIGGRTFLCHPPKIDELKEIEIEFKRQILASDRDPFAVVAKAITDAEKSGTPLPKVMVDSMVQSAMTRKIPAKPPDPTPEQLGLHGMTVEGCRYLVWVLARQNDAALKLEDVSPWVANETEAYTALQKCNKILSLAKADPN
jgi:hypothetical protein